MEELQSRRGPGRPPKEIAPDQLQAVGETENARRRSARKPFGSMQQKLSYVERPGFHRHWFNDIPGRVNAALEAGYEHVNDREGKKVCHIVGTAESGGPLHAYLMEIPEEWYREDMAAQQAENDARMAAIKDPRAAVKDADPRDQDKFYLGKETAPARRT